MAFPSDYQVPSNSSASRYHNKFEQGKTKFRVLSNIISGDVWFEDNQPTRVKNSDTRKRPEEARHFIAFAAYNYNSESVQIFEIPQITIIKQLKDLEDNEDWGDLTGYDVTVNRQGEGRDTEYTVSPVPHKDVEKSIVEEYKNLQINLNALYEGASPFGGTASDQDDDEFDIDDLLSEFDGKAPQA